MLNSMKRVLYHANNPEQWIEEQYNNNNLLQ